MREVIALVVLFTLMAGAAGAEPESSRPARHGTGWTITWTAVGAGAGFGLGAWIGLTAFDDAINSDRKVWTTALLSAAGVGVLGYVLSRPRDAEPTTVTNRRSRPAVRNRATPAADVEAGIVARYRSLGTGRGLTGSRTPSAGPR